MSDISDVRVGIYLDPEVQAELRDMAGHRSLKLATYCRMILTDHARGTELDIPPKPKKVSRLNAVK